LSQREQHENKYKGDKVALFLLLFITILVLGCPSVILAENYVAFFVDGYQKGCSVKSKGEDYNCTEHRHLYKGDVISKKPDIKSVKIKWGPYSSGTILSQTALVVLFEPPKNGKGMVQSTREAFGLLKTAPRPAIGATRGPNRIPQPGNNATLIWDEVSTFAWGRKEGETILFKDNDGKDIYKKRVTGTCSVQLSPRQIGMKSGGTYVWTVIGIMSEPSKVRVLSSDLAVRVTSGLNEIEGEPINKTEKLLRKAFFLQFLSDAYPKELDVYWLSYLLLSEARNENFNEEDRNLFEYLTVNYFAHVTDSYAPRSRH